MIVLTENILEKVNKYLLETESLANEFLPLKETLEPIQNDFRKALEDLKQKSEDAEDLADRVFYINRYTDLIRKLETVFDTRSKRLQQTLAMLTKLPTTYTENKEEQTDNLQTDEEKTQNLTPEQANEILMILKQTK